jgi:hypothetical protein
MARVVCGIVLGLLVCIAAIPSVGIAADELARSTDLASVSHCVLIACFGGCDQGDAVYRCWQTSIADGPIIPDFPQLNTINLTAKADCWVVTPLGVLTKSCVKSKLGKGRVTVSTHCWIDTIWVGPSGNDGGCRCLDLHLPTFSS